MVYYRERIQAETSQGKRRRGRVQGAPSLSFQVSSLWSRGRMDSSWQPCGTWSIVNREAHPRFESWIFNGAPSHGHNWLPMWWIRLQLLHSWADTTRPKAPTLQGIIAETPITLLLSGWLKAARQTKTLLSGLAFLGLRDHLPEVEVWPVFGRAFWEGWVFSLQHTPSLASFPWLLLSGSWLEPGCLLQEQ